MDFLGFLPSAWFKPALKQPAALIRSLTRDSYLFFLVVFVAPNSSDTDEWRAAEKSGPRWIVFASFFLFFFITLSQLLNFISGSRRLRGPLLPPIGTMGLLEHADMINLKEREAPREAPEGSRVDQRGRWWKLALGRPSVSDTTNPSAERPRVSSDCVRMEAPSDQEFVFESYCYYHY